MLVVGNYRKTCDGDVNNAMMENTDREICPSDQMKNNFLPITSLKNNFPLVKEHEKRHKMFNKRSI